MTSVRARRALAAALIAAGVLFSLWKCRFGLELFDEPSFIVPGFKLFALGDRPFAQEALSGAKQASLLNFLLARPLLPYRLLALRRAAVGLHALALLGLAWACFRGELGLAAAVGFLACFVFDQYDVRSWSHNAWSRNLLLAHHIALLRASRAPPGAARKAPLAVAGILMGLATVAYNPLVAAGALAAAAAVLGPARGDGVPYALGFASVLAPYAAYCLAPGVRPDWLLAMRSTAAEYFPGGAASLLARKSAAIAGFILSRPEFWATLLARWTPGWASLRRYPWMVAAGAAFLAYELSRLARIGPALGALVGIGMAAAWALGRRALQSKDGPLLMMVAASLAAAFSMALSSINGPWALLWAMPSLILPYMALQARTARPAGAALAVPGALLAALSVGTISYHMRFNHRDAPMRDCAAELGAPPLQGIRTSPRRAYLVESLSRLLAGRRFILAWDRLPGAFYFDGTRPSSDDIRVKRDLPREVALRSLRRMLREERFPEVIVKVKVDSWAWGLARPEPLRYGADDPYALFADCARARVVADYPEFAAYETDPSRLRVCAGAIASAGS